MVSAAPEDDERTTLTRIAAGDRGAVAEALTWHGERLRQIVRVRLHPALRARIDVSDVVQEASLEIVARAADVAQRSLTAQELGVPFFVWMRATVLQSVAAAHRRHLGAEGRDARREAGFDGLAASGVLLVDRLAASGVTPSGIVAAEELRARLSDALEGLADEDRELLLLRYFEGLSNDEAASALGVSASAASRRRVRALEALRHALARVGIDGDLSVLRLAR